MENKNVICPIYFEDHTFGGHVGSIENFTNIDLGTVRTTFLNGRVYFAARDLCRGLYLNPERSTEFTLDAINDILSGYYNISNDGGVSYRENLNINTPTATGWGCLNQENIHNRFKKTFYMDPEELYFYITIDITHPIGNSNKMVTQKVNTLFVSEPVLYMLTFRSRKKEAIAFKAWLAMDVLPNLRALGKDNTAIMISNEYSNIVNSLHKIDDIYDNIKDYDAKNSHIRSGLQDLIFGQRSEYQAIRQLQDSIMVICHKLQDMGCEEDFIAGNTNIINEKLSILNNNTNILNEKVTNVASGLNYVFGQH